MQLHFTASAEIHAFIDYMVVGRNKSERTAVEYARDLARFDRFLDEKPLTEASTDDIERWRDSLRREGRNQPQSIRRKLAAVSSFFKWWVKKKKGRLDNPFDEDLMPQCSRPLPKVMTEDEAELLLNARVKHRRHAELLTSRTRAMMEVIYGAGLRRFEACGLDLLDVDLRNMKVRVRHGKGDKERYSFLTEPAAEAVRAYLEVRPKYVTASSGAAMFITIKGDRITPRQLWSEFARLRKAAKEDGLTKDIVLHTLRHSFATHLYRRSRNIRAVQKLLGHSSINTTERYTHIEDDELREIYESSHPRAKAS